DARRAPDRAVVATHGHAARAVCVDRHGRLQRARAPHRRRRPGRCCPRRGRGSLSGPVSQPARLARHGVSTGAALGAVTGIYLSLGVVAIQSLAFVVGLGAVAVVYATGAALRRHDPILVLVLAGIVIGPLLGSLVSLLKYLADPYDQLPAITFWLLGSLASVTIGDVKAVTPSVVLGLIPLVLLRWRMNVMTLGEAEARALGVDTRRLRLAVIAAATLMTAGV